MNVGRDVVILACAVSAGIHGALAPAHFAEGTGAGVGFAVAAILLAGLAVALTLRPASSLLPAGAAAIFAGLLGSYVLATTTGAPFLHPESEPVDGLALATKAFEAVGLLAALKLRRTPAVRPIPLALTVLVGLFVALTALAVSNGHDTHVHDHAVTVTSR